MAKPEILQLKKVPSSRIIKPSPVLPARFDKELTELSNKFINLLRQNRAEILQNQALMERILKSKGIKNSKEMGNVIRQILDDQGISSSNRPGRLPLVRRALANALLTSPDYKFKDTSLADLMEGALSEGNATKARQAMTNFTDKIIRSVDQFKVWHHGTGLLNLLEAVDTLPDKMRPQVLNILEDMGFKLGEKGGVQILNLAHTTKDLGGLRKDWKEALGGIKDIDKINKKLKPLLSNLMAHSERFGGSEYRGRAIPPSLLKGIDDPFKAAMAMAPYISEVEAATKQGMSTSKLIESIIFDKKGNILTDTLKEGGKLQTALEKLPVMSSAGADQIYENALWNSRNATRRWNWKTGSQYFSQLPGANVIQGIIDNPRGAVGGLAFGAFLDPNVRKAWGERDKEAFVKAVGTDIAAGSVVESMSKAAINAGLRNPKTAALTAKVLSTAGPIMPAVAPITAGAVIGNWMKDNVSESNFVSGRGAGRAAFTPDRKKAPDDDELWQNIFKRGQRFLKIR